MNVPEGLRYTKEHEWARLEGGDAVIGITDYAQSELGDIVFVEMPAPGKKTEQGKSCASIEAVKAVSDLFAPLSGELVEVNKDLEASPQLVNQDPYGKGWILKIRLSDKAQWDGLMQAAEYMKLIG
ncbi:glycine cleavage system protein GcvH [bacterium]|nr:glycine cleavage system protein GcvH [bacterium]